MTLNTKSLSNNTLKLVAITAMVIDHIGAGFYPDLMILRLIGRLTMPIFAYLLTVGYRQTHDFKKYQLRVLIFAIIAIYPYMLYFDQGPFNILFTLWAGLLMLYIYDHFKFKTLTLIVFVIATTVLGFEGSAIVIPLIFIFHVYHDKPHFYSLGFVILQGVFLINNILIANSIGLSLTDYSVWGQTVSLLALIFIRRYNGQKGFLPIPKYFFYAFYPLHITLLFLVKHFM